MKSTSKIANFQCFCQHSCSFFKMGKTNWIHQQYFRNSNLSYFYCIFSSIICIFAWHLPSTPCPPTPPYQVHSDRSCVSLPHPVFSEPNTVLILGHDLLNEHQKVNSVFPISCQLSDKIKCCVQNHPEYKYTSSCKRSRTTHMADSLWFHREGSC